MEEAGGGHEAQVFDLHSSPESKPEFDRSDPLWSLKAVGPAKPLGYLSTLQITEAGQTVEAMAAASSQKQLDTRYLEGDQTKIKPGALFVYDRAALAALLDSRADVLSARDWPNDPDLFVAKVATTVERPGSQLYDLIADVFGDYDNPWRSDQQSKAA